MTERYYGNDSFDNLIKLGLPKKSNTTTPDVSTTPLAPATPTAPAPQPNSNVGNTWDTAVQDYGVIGQSMNPRAREIDVPQRTTADNRISDFLCSALESPQIRDEWVADVNSDAMLAGYYRGRRADSLEYREVKADYSVRWLKLSVELVEYPNSKDIEVYLMYEDINETKRT